MPPVASPNVSIPHPRPSAVPNPVPDADLAAQASQPAAPGTSSIPQAPTSAGAPAAPPDDDALFAELDAAGQAPSSGATGATPGPANGAPDDDAALFAELDAAGGQGPAPAGQSEAPAEQLDENAPGAGTGDRIMAGLGRSPEEQRRLLAKSLGAGYETKLGGKKDKEVLFRKTGDEKFQRMDPGFFNSAKDFAKDLAALGTKIGVDAAGAIAGEALGIAGGAAVGGPVGAVAGAVGGAALGGAASSAAHEAVIQGLGVEPAVDFRRDAAFNALLNVGTLGAGTLLKTPLKAAVSKIGEALAETPFARVSKLAKVREGIDEIQKAIGYGPKPDAALGKQVMSATDQLAEQLGSQIGAVNDKALVIAGNRRFPVPGFQDRLKGLLQEQGVSFNANGMAEIPAGLEALKPFGAPEGMAAVKSLVSDYNQLARNNGTMDLKQLTNTLSFYKDPAGFGERLPSSVNGAYQVLRGSLRTERDKVLPEVLAGTPEGEFAKSAYANYAQRIDTIRDLQNKALRKGSPEKFAEALIAPKDSAGVQALKQTFGEDSVQFNTIKSAWFGGLIDKAVDNETGIVSGQMLKKELKRYGDDVVGELLTPAQKNAVNALASNAEKISYNNLVKNPENNTFLRHVAGAALGSYHGHPAAIAHTTWSLFSNNKAALDYLTNDGLLELAKQTADPAGRTGYVKAAQWLGKMISAADISVAKNGRKSYVLPLEMPVISALINANEKQDGETAQDFLQRKQDTLSEVTGR